MSIDNPKLSSTRIATYHHVKAIRVVRLEFLPLCFRALSVQLDVFVTSLEILRNLGFDALVRGDDDSGCAVHLEQLREDETRWPGSDDEGVDAHSRVQLVQAVDGTRRGFN